jgi:hypothetical protein
VVHEAIAPREVREAARLTQAQMASLMGMSLSGYRKWEQGSAAGQRPGGGFAAGDPERAGGGKAGAGVRELLRVAECMKFR